MDWELFSHHDSETIMWEVSYLGLSWQNFMVYFYVNVGGVCRCVVGIHKHSCSGCRKTSFVHNRLIFNNFLFIFLNLKSIGLGTISLPFLCFFLSYFTPSSFYFWNILLIFCSRFVLNVPKEDLQSFERILFLVEYAHWFYEDNSVEKNPSLKSFTLKEFTSLCILCWFPFPSHRPPNYFPWYTIIC